MQEAIKLRGVKQNNLKNIDIDIPLGKFTVITGLSGSGKSSLAFETLYAEGQRRYAETFSAYTRQFLELLDKANVDDVQNIRPAIALEQKNAVRTSRSTVGTMTELCDYFKVWFSQVATLYDPDSGQPIHDDNPQSAWKQMLKQHAAAEILITFSIDRPKNFSTEEILKSISAQGYSRIITDGSMVKIEDIIAAKTELSQVTVIQDRIKIEAAQRNRFIESATVAFRFGHGEIGLYDINGGMIQKFSAGLRSPVSGKTYHPASPAMFSFNSPIGACPHCKGFGRTFDIDLRRVIPDTSLSLNDGAIKAFHGPINSQSLGDLQRVAAKNKIRLDVPWRDLSEHEQQFVIKGQPEFNGENWDKYWYGIDGFFRYMESRVYKMHVRVFLSKFRSYQVCPHCEGKRLKPESLLWRWQGHTLPELYLLSVKDLLALVKKHIDEKEHASKHATAMLPWDSVLQNILTRLRYLETVGLSYLTLDRTTRTLSGGETQRVNLTTCLGTSLYDTLFVLDEPSVGLHPADIHRLVGILRSLTASGNTVVVVEHDEMIMRAADNIIEIGPEPGKRGGQLVFSGNMQALSKAKHSLTADYIFDKKTIMLPPKCKVAKSTPRITFTECYRHNLQGITLDLPLELLVVITGLSGSGKSTLLQSVIHEGIADKRGLATETRAEIKKITAPKNLFPAVAWIDQSPLSKTPRSTPAVYLNVWEDIRSLLASTEEAKSYGLEPGAFSFNGGDGRCPHCLGLGYEQVEMQFLSDVFITCPVCEGKRFRKETLAIRYQGKNASDFLEMEAKEAYAFFSDHPKIQKKLLPLIDIGLGYLPLGQALNTLSGGESQRLKLVHALTLEIDKTGKGKKSKKTENDSDSEEDGSIENESKHSGGKQLILLDEPTTGLHRQDVQQLLLVLRKLQNLGHSIVVVEHQTDVITAADWIIEMGPGAGADGGKIIFAGTVDDLNGRDTATAKALRDIAGKHQGKQRSDFSPPSSPNATKLPSAIALRGAREHNLKDISVDIPLRKLSVISGISGSGKSTLAFDILFAEGQRRFMESMSAYARQFVEQLPKPDIESLSNIPPTVSIEQRLTRGSMKSTVATITEVAQYLRLLYSKLGIQFSPQTGKPLTESTFDDLLARIHATGKKQRGKLLLFAPLVKGRKGHYQPLANWARRSGYEFLRCDGKLVRTDAFTKLDRYKEHDIEICIADLGKTDAKTVLQKTLDLGRGNILLCDAKGKAVASLSTERTDPITGEAYPELEPKSFSWNSPKGWCPTCRGYGFLFKQKSEDETEVEIEADAEAGFEDGQICPDCHGQRINRISRNVFLPIQDGSMNSLPELLSLGSSDLLSRLKELKLDKRGSNIARDILAQIEERLKFMDRVGLSYLTLDRATATLSGGEAQRIRLAAQLGSNLSGALYILDEPSIGLHARDNDKLLLALRELNKKENTILVVEHDEDTIRQADYLIDIGPGAGKHGGEIMASGTVASVLKNKNSLTGKLLRESIPHPINGSYRDVSFAEEIINGLPSQRRQLGQGDRKISKKKIKNPSSSVQSAASVCQSSPIILSEPTFRNLKGGSIIIPQGCLTVVCGVSGAGKSTLIRDLLYPLVNQAIKGNIARLDYKTHYKQLPQSLKNNPLTEAKPTAWSIAPINKKQKISRSKNLCSSDKSAPSVFHELCNANAFRQVIEVDQSPIGKTPRSSPATYIGVFDMIRDIFAQLPDAKMRGFSSGTFSYNTEGGRCEFCKGAGKIKVEMNFLPDSYVTCEECNGTRYGPELADIRLRGKNIADVLAMTFEDAAVFFESYNRLKLSLDLINETGLGYLTLGQASPTLSGGEAQRLKLVAELLNGITIASKEKAAVRLQNFKPNLYLLEEPTIGLHLSDCEKLIRLLQKMADQGHSVVVIEHHLDIIKEADWLIELGPEGGESGGHILYQGNLSGIKKVKSSPTGKYL